MNTNQNHFDITALNPVYKGLISASLRQAEGYNLVPLGTYNGQTAYIEGRTNTLYIGTQPSNARRLTIEGLEEVLQ